jgi:putative copper export protein
MLDVLSVLLRAAAFMLLFQATGAVIFLRLFDRDLTRSRPFIELLARAAAGAAILFVTAHQLLEPARMAGELSGVLDFSLQQMALMSSNGVAFGLRLLGLGLILIGGRRSAGLLGVLSVVVSFVVTGHTAVHPDRAWLLPLLLAHVLIVAFWFGSFWPLLLVVAREAAQGAARVVAGFSRLAVGLVLLIPVAGLGIAWALLPGLAALRQPYGELLISKVALFGIVMIFAALNKQRLGPALAREEPRAPARFRASVLAELVLVCLILAVTAVMTALFSPE